MVKVDEYRPAKTLQIPLAIGVVLRKLTRMSVLCDVLRIEKRWR
jgi:hypothetical protein